MNKMTKDYLDAREMYNEYHALIINTLRKLNFTHGTLSVKGFITLDAINSNPHSSGTDIRLLTQSREAISAVVDTLIREDYVSDYGHGHGRRYVITDKGKEVLKVVHEATKNE